MAKWMLKRPMRLVLDYDGTLTVQDTMSILGTLSKKPKLSWKEIVNAYMQDYEAWQKQDFSWKNYDRTEYSSWLASRKSIECQSALRVQQSGFFKGVTQRDVEGAVDRAFESGALKLRSGWEDLVQTCPSVEIISVNWSETAIRHALKGSPVPLEVFANEIEGLDDEEGSTGELICDDDIRSSDDKLRCMKDNQSTLLTVYVGDSSTDFDCLCEADVGIWLYDVPEEEYEEASKKVFAPLKYVPPPLRTLDDLDRAGEAMFYWAPNFRTVLEVLCVEDDR